MLSFLKSVNAPVNLIRQPIEKAIVLVWLIAIAQFISYSFITDMTPSSGWLLTAPALMIASVIIAIRSGNSLSLTVTFSAGVIPVLYLINGDLSSISIWQHSPQTNINLMIICVYTLLFWILIKRYLKSRYFLNIQTVICLNQEKSNVHYKFISFLFFLSFIILNSCVVLSFVHPGSFSVINISVAMVFLFVSGKTVSGQIRGLLLPVYMTMILIVLVSISSATDTLMVGPNTLNTSSVIYLIWGFLLWCSHNFIVPHYNKIFPDLRITTHLWPWYGLLVLMSLFIQQAPHLLYNSSYLLIVLGYLFLMLKNTALPLISWSIVLLLSWLVLVVLSLFNPVNFPFRDLSMLGDYGVHTFYFSFTLLSFAVLWQQTINRYFIQLGWQKISFIKPVLLVSFVVSTFWLIANMILVTGMISGWYNLMNEGLFIEKTTALLFISFIVLYLFMDNKLLANLSHFSFIILLIVLWGANKPVPIYMLFAIIHFLWVLLPTALNALMKRFSLFKLQSLVSTSANWIYSSFVAAIISLFYMADSQTIGMDSMMFLSSIGILFMAALVMISKMATRNSYQLWIVLSYLLASGLVVSLRFMILGAEPLGAYDTAGIMVISFLLFYINRYHNLASPIINSDTLVKILPLTALFTISWQTGSTHSSITLLILGLFYFLIQKGNRFTFYCGFAFINLAVYLWIPLISTYTGLLLFYIAPVSVTLLLLSHLHRDEMKPDLKNKIRFMALSTLYLILAADVFINETLLVFVLALLLGLVSVIYGISNRIRAFLYTGIIFLLVTILTQLFILYPDGRLERALILMTTGVAITGSMIWFNIKREMLLSKVRLFRTDLDSWE